MSEDESEININKILATYEGNNICSDCETNDPDWGVNCVLLKTYVFVCIKCSGIHRDLGTHISKVKSTKYDVYKPELLNFVIKQGGNKVVNDIIQGGKPFYIVNPKISDNEDVLKWFIRTKYQKQAFSINNYNNEMNKFNAIMKKNNNNNNNDAESKDDDNKNNNNNNNNNINNNINNNKDSKFIICDCIVKMPRSGYIGTFLGETNKKKYYLQLFENQLYIFKNGGDAKDIEHYNINNLQLIIIDSDEAVNSNSKNDDAQIAILQIKNIKLDKIIYKLRSFLFQNINQLINFVHNVNINKLYYNKLHYIKSNNILNNVTQLNQKFPHIETGFTQNIVKQYIQLGFAHKKAGVGNNWRKRFWLIYNNRLYYFKSNFIKENKYNNKDNKPQGSILLMNSSIVYDINKQRTGKNNSFLIITHERTYYMYTDDDETFFNTIYNVINKNTKYIYMDCVKQQQIQIQ